MSWVTVIWSVGVGACLTLAFIQFVVWWKYRAARANLAFSVLAIAVAAFAALELTVMRAETSEQFGTVARWIHVPAWVIVVSLVAFVRLYLRAGRPWLGWAVIGFRTLSLLLNFLFSPNINYWQVTPLRHVSFLGESVSIPTGVPNPWMLIAQFSLLLLVIFVMDAAITVWRRGETRQALVVGGGIVLFVVMATAQAMAVTWQIIPMPLTVSLFFQGLVAVMACELSYDMIHAAVLARRLQTSEANLREGEERMSLAAEAANLAVWEWDLSTDEVWTTGTHREVPGRPVSEKGTMEDFISQLHIDDRDRVRQALKDAIDSGKDFACEFRFMLRNGCLRWATARGRCINTADGKNIRFRGVSMDVTAQKDVDNLFRLATESSLSGVALVNKRGEIILVNSQVEKLFGYQRDELVGESVEILVPKRFAGQHPAYRAKFLATPTARAMGAGRELFARRKDGSEFPVEIGLNPIQTPDGFVVLTTIVDISARKAAEEETRRSRQQVELLSRASLLGEMTASLAHELNQPLAAIVNNATAAMQYLEKGRLDPKQLQEILSDVVGDGRRAYEIISSVRSAIKKGSAIRGPVNLNDVVNAVAHMLQPDAAERLCNIEISLAPDLPAIEGDPTQVQQVLINLMSNAIDAMRDTPRSRRIVEITTNHNGDGTILVGVRDYGSGISEATRERLFEKFFTTKEEGLGMGLAIVRSIVEAHGGSIVAENADGGGAHFRFRLPVTS